jgi:hypothetical protein
MMMGSDPQQMPGMNGSPVLQRHIDMENIQYPGSPSQ